MMPYCASRNVIGVPRLVANQLRMRCDCAVTSGPIPSPPTTAILVMLDRLFMLIFLRSVSTGARRDRKPGRPGFHRRVAMSAGPHRGPQEGRRDGADRFQSDDAFPKAT